ncbi:Crp/Fnr family transcriptional regulator [Ramlibacter sp. PS4R-6]|uniref:Crp/Fnr family transcriptional regulator n=1 Tax=Ramlibacter sp. PS4R-6 TaxID=3133438 RepID=UPI0030A79F55
MRVLSLQEARALEANEWFGLLGDEVKADLLQHSAVLRLPAGRTVSSQGSVPEVWCAVAAGAVQVCTRSDAGAEVVLDLLEPGQWFGDVPLLSQRRLPYSVRTWQPSTLLLMRRNALLQVCARHPSLPPALAELNWELAQRIGQRACDQVETSTLQRTFGSLRALGQRFGTRVADGVRIEMPLTQSELARLAGSSRQRVNEALAQLQLQGRIRRGPGYIDLPQPR